MPDENETGPSKELQAAMLAALSVKSQMIPFWRDSPTAWFAHFEAVIEPQHKTDQQKYTCLLRELQEQDLKNIADILKNPPEVGRYKALKERLIAVYEESSTRKYQKLNNGLPLGDQKPSQLLRQMRELACGMLTDAGLKVEWLKQLPAHIRTILSAKVNDSLDTLAIIADRVIEYEAPAGASLSAVEQKTQHNYTDITQRIDMLASELAALRTTCTGREAIPPNRLASRSRTPPTRSHRSYSPFPRQQTKVRGYPRVSYEVCWYHKTFGPNARRCEQPCNYKKDSQGNFSRHQ